MKRIYDIELKQNVLLLEQNQRLYIPPNPIGSETGQIQLSGLKYEFQ